MTSTRRDTAAQLAGRGLFVFPCGTPGAGHDHPAGSDSSCPACKREKAPRRGWKWADRNSADPAVVAANWPADEPNIGVACKPSGLLVVDLDRHTPGADGIDTFTKLCETRGVAWPRTFTVRTSSGGTHLYYRAPSGRPLSNSAGRLGPGIDSRGPGDGNQGGYVLGPGSVVGGGGYEVTHDVDIAPLPDWLADLLTPKPPPAARPQQFGAMPAAGGPYAAAALRKSIERVLAAPRGERNDTLNRAAYGLGRLVGAGILDHVTVVTALERAGEAVGLTGEDGLRQTAATIRSGLSAGLKVPHTPRGAR